MNKLPDGWEELELKDVVSFEKKSKRKAGDGLDAGKYKFFTSSPVQSKYLDEADFEGDALIFGTGGSASVHYCAEPFSATTDCYIAKSRSENVLPKAVYYYLLYRLDLVKKGFKGAGLKHVSKEHLKKISILLPPIDQQEKIISILDQADQLTQHRQQADQLTKQYLQSTFYEMFGDPVTNPKGWEVKELAQVCNEIYRYPTFYGFEYVEEGVPVVRIGDILEDGSVSSRISDYVFVDLQISEQYPRTVLEMNDILMAVRGDGSTAKKIGIVKEETVIGGNISPNLLRIKVDDKMVNPDYAYYFLTSKGGQSLLKRLIRRAAKKTITATRIKKIKIPKPPIELQNHFGDIVTDVDKLHHYQQKSSEQINDFFNSIMQRAFRGELTC